jgi:hypothetical protein
MAAPSKIPSTGISQGVPREGRQHIRQPICLVLAMGLLCVVNPSMAEWRGLHVCLSLGGDLPIWLPSTGAFSHLDGNLSVALILPLTS